MVNRDQQILDSQLMIYQNDLLINTHYSPFTIHPTTMNI